MFPEEDKEFIRKEKDPSRPGEAVRQAFPAAPEQEASNGFLDVCGTKNGWSNGLGNPLVDIRIAGHPPELLLLLRGEGHVASSSSWSLGLHLKITHL